MTAQECLRVGIEARERLHAAGALPGIVQATALAARRAGEDFSPELLVFHGSSAERLFSTAALADLASAGVSLTVLEDGLNLPGGPAAGQVQFANEVLAGRPAAVRSPCVHTSQRSASGRAWLPGPERRRPGRRDLQARREAGKRWPVVLHRRLPARNLPRDFSLDGTSGNHTKMAPSFSSRTTP